MEISLKGKTALVTGASQGIGEAIARTYAEAGATVILSSRRVDRLETIAHEIRAGGGDARVAAADLAKGDEALALAAAAGPVDILVNNAAATLDIAPPMPIVSSTDELWDTTMTINLRSPYLLCRALGKGMAERRSGCIINISSTAGAERVLPWIGIYSTSKAALNVLTKVLALELGTFGVRANAISPGLIETPAIAEAPAAAAKAFYASIPLGRGGMPAEVAGVALWLASDQASYVTGQIITIDGGMTAGAFGMGTDSKDS